MRSFIRFFGVWVAVITFSSCGMDIERVSNEDFQEDQSDDEEERAARLTLDPESVENMDVDGNWDTALVFGSLQEFTVTNEGEVDSDPIELSLSNLDNFEVVTDDCSDHVLTPASICQIEIRVKADNNELYSANLTLTTDNAPSATLSGTASNFYGVGDPFQGGIFAGVFNDGTTDHVLVAMPGGCDGTTNNPVCEGTDGADINFIWADATGVATGAQSLNDGPSNTATIVASGHTETPAASYCHDMSFGGYVDWYLPAREELSHLYDNRGAIGGFDTMSYWSSSELSGNPENAARGANFGNGLDTNANKVFLMRVRCVRRVIK